MGNWERKDEFYYSYYDKTMKDTHRKILVNDHKSNVINTVMVGLVATISFCVTMSIF